MPHMRHLILIGPIKFCFKHIYIPEVIKTFNAQPNWALKRLAVDQSSFYDVSFSFFFPFYELAKVDFQG